MIIKVIPRSKNIKPLEIDASSYQDFVKQCCLNFQINSNRLKISISQNGKIQTITNDYDFELMNAKEVYVKDLGPQIGWRNVYLIEYFGPILIHFCVFNYICDEPIEYKLIYEMNLIHYFKREFENIFIHKFSNSTMPLFNLFKNCAHYWILGGLLSLMYKSIGNINFNLNLNLNKDFLFYLWCFCEIFNGITHIQLRLLGDKSIRKGLARQVPKGGFFEIFISPNYTMEIYGWIIVFLMNPNIFTLVFIVVGTVQMYLWSVKKQKKYGTRRWFLVPYVI